MKTYRIAVIAGDGIGKEVIPAGIEVLNAGRRAGRLPLRVHADIPWGCDYYLQTGRMMDADGVDQLMKFDAIYLGAIGDPRVPDAHLGARADPAAAAAARAVRQPAADAADARHHVAARRTAAPPTST